MRQSSIILRSTPNLPTVVGSGLVSLLITPKIESYIGDTIIKHYNFDIVEEQNINKQRVCNYKCVFLRIYL